MKKIGLIITLVTLISGSANAGYTNCYQTCYGNSCTVSCYSY